ncbi:hypothetical protein Tsubulata_031592 [Turnera subulata]|uniref:CASP-like protein n=1 Tax=Turnera subulata TaxID=218843 RepID=A0A9Q0F5I4_9ROSI|nr:hypothetical protein Tsubulata_031592 [Turnera subulata]
MNTEESDSQLHQQQQRDQQHQNDQQQPQVQQQKQHQKHPQQEQAEEEEHQQHRKDPPHEEQEGLEQNELQGEEPEHKEQQLQEQEDQETEQEQEQEQEQERYPIPSSKPTFTMYHPSPPLTPLSPPLGPTSPPPTRPDLFPPSSSPPDSSRFSDHSPDSHHHANSYFFSPSSQATVPSQTSTQPPPTGAAVEAGFKAQDGVDVGRVEEGGGAGATRGRRLRPSSTMLRKAERESIRKKALLGSRSFAFVFCLISFSIMAADKDQGWALDSFHRYKEFRYCMAVNVLGFLYSGLQGYDLAYSLTTGKYIARDQLRHVLTYLLLSASSSAAFRVEDWESNWGKDKFPSMAKASVSLSFLAFVAFALSSLLSGYTFFTPNPS